RTSRPSSAATVLAEYITAGSPASCLSPPWSLKPRASGVAWSISGISSSAWRSSGGISSSQSSSGSAAWAVEASARQQSSETMNGRMAATWKMNGAAERPRGESVLAAGHHAVDHQQDDRTDHGADKARALAG